MNIIISTTALYLLLDCLAFSIYCLSDPYISARRLNDAIQSAIPTIYLVGRLIQSLAIIQGDITRTCGDGTFKPNVSASSRLEITLSASNNTIAEKFFIIPGQKPRVGDTVTTSIWEAVINL